MLITEQEKEIGEAEQSIPSYNHALLNRIKNRKNKTEINIEKIIECFNLSQKEKISAKFYKNMKENMEKHEKFEREMINKINSTCMVTGKSLKTMKSFRTVRID